MSIDTQVRNELSRRSFFHHAGLGLHGAALTYLLRRDLFAATPGKPHFDAKAKAVIHLFMNGGPSQMDLFDPKPTLDRLHGKPYFDRIAGEVENPQSAGAIMRSPFRFARHGQSGTWVSSAMPHLARQVDDLALVRSMYTTNLTQEPAIYRIQSGKMGPGRPSLGSWVVYGLGSESQNLPAYVVLDDPLGLPINGTENWDAGFLPPQYQGTRFRSTGSPVLNLRTDSSRPGDAVNLERDLHHKLDRMHQRERPRQPVLDARIASYELAARMQLAAGDALDLSREPPAIQEMYGIGKK